VSKRYAIVSIGTNSTRLLLADVAPEIPRVEIVRSVGTRIGEGLGERGLLDDDAMERTLEAVRQFARTVRGHYVRMFAVTTSAMRRAENGEGFSARVQSLLGAPLRVLSGEEEAEASYRGALTALGELRGERVGVVDVGGGSTEYAIGTSAQPEKVTSCEIGAVRLTEAVPELAGRDGAVDERVVERARTLARKSLEPLKDCAAVERLALVGGSATTTAAMLRGRRTPITTARLKRSDLQHVLAQLLPMPLEERKKVAGMKPQRADILPGGIIVLDTAMEVVGRDEAVATSADLLLGVLLAERDAAAGQRPAAPAGSGARRGFRP
jgi:exopolyphosphatase / guanosine-5'-triphosphate,3'-diphosphate pyrophosphatase